MTGFVKAQKESCGAKEVVIDYQKGFSELTWAKDRKFDYAVLKKAVAKSSDLALRAVTITARSEVTERDGKPAFKVTGRGELFLLDEEGAAKLLDAAKTGGKLFVITARVQEPKDAKEPLTIFVERFEEDAKAER